jgi:hypothetical protein
LIEVAFPGSVV